MKIFVHLSGGNIQAVYSSCSDAEIFIIDEDVNTDAELELADQRQSQLEKAIKNGEVTLNY